MNRKKRADEPADYAGIKAFNAMIEVFQLLLEQRALD